jgi:hypothetical protein
VAKELLTGMDRIDRMGRSAECGMMNDELEASGLSFIIHHSAFIISYPVHPC